MSASATQGGRKEEERGKKKKHRNTAAKYNGLLDWAAIISTVQKLGNPGSIRIEERL